jgi:hypothetical protein
MARLTERIATARLSEAQSRKAVEMIEDRNLTVHTYEEALARQIAARVPEYACLLSSWIEAVASQPSRD